MIREVPIPDPIGWARDKTGELIGDAASAVAGNAIEKFAEAVAEGVAESIKAMATLWLKVPPPDVGPGSAAVNLQDSLWWYMAFAAVLSIIIGGGRMAWESRGEAGRELIKSLITLVVVSGAGLATLKLALDAGDGFSEWIIGNSFDGDGFAKKMTALLADVTSAGGAQAGATTGGMGAILVILVGLIVILASMVQIVLMIGRSAMLVLLAGILPLSAAATNTSWGRQWFQKTAGWMIAFVLYKPAAAIVYAAAFELFGTAEGLMGALMAMAMMVLAIFALPALMRLCVPLVGGMSGGSGGGGGGAAAAGGLMASGGSSKGPSGAAPVPATMHTGGGGAGASGAGGAAGAGTAGKAAAGGGAAAGGPVGVGVAAGAMAAKAGTQAVKDGAQRTVGEDGPRGSN